MAIVSVFSALFANDQRRNLMIHKQKQKKNCFYPERFKCQIYFNTIWIDRLFLIEKTKIQKPFRLSRIIDFVCFILCFSKSIPVKRFDFYLDLFSFFYTVAQVKIVDTDFEPR